MTTQTTVRTDDGLSLHVEVDPGPPGAPTVVMVHGFTASLEEFAGQRATLAGRATVVLYDQRGHGRSRVSGRVRRATIEQTGRDLDAVLSQIVPAGPVVLLGHSMGGMTLMALARLFPSLFGSRVAGVFLLATSAGGLVERGVAGVLVRLARALGVLGLLLGWFRLVAPLLERLRRRGSALGRVFYRRSLFGRDDADPEQVRVVQELLEQTRVQTIAAFYPTLIDHDEEAALAVLAAVPVTILVGDSDRLTPPAHSRRMAALLPDAELVVVPGAGHSVNLTRPAVVDDALLRLLERSSGVRAASGAA